MKFFLLCFFLFLSFRSTSGFLGLWGGKEERKEESMFEMMWESVPQKYQESIFAELKKEASFSALLRFFFEINLC